jgi:hypothetical protein
MRARDKLPVFGRRVALGIVAGPTAVCQFADVTSFRFCSRSLPICLFAEDSAFVLPAGSPSETGR